MTTMLPLLIQLISGAAGSNIVGKLLKNLNLSKVLSTVLGGVGGGLGGLLLSVLGIGGAAAAGGDAAAGAEAIGGVLQGMGGLEGVV